MVVIFIGGAIFFSLTGGTFIRILAPVWSGETAVGRGLNNLYLFLRSKDSLIKENQILKTKVNEDAVLLVSTQVVANNQNNILKDLGRTGTKGGIIAAVLVHPPETPYDTLIIDVGKNEGISLGQVVALTTDSTTSIQGPKIGIISEVYATNSKVKLYSASGDKTNAVLERNSVPVILLGRGGGNFEFTLPREVNISIGDKILSSDISHNLVGIVRDIEMQATDSFKKILVVSAANVYTTGYVTVLK